MSVIKKVNVNGQEYELAGAGGGASSSILEITYSELKLLKESSSLVQEQKYRITDYVSLFKADYINSAPSFLKYKSAEHPFDLIVTAKDSNSFYDIANAINHEGDEYFASAKLDKWVVYYSFDNNESLYPVDENCKGFIYRMIDEYNNDATFDFKNFMFAVNADTIHNISSQDPFVNKLYSYFYLFSKIEGTTTANLSSANDASITGIAKNNTVDFNSFSSIGESDVACVLAGIKGFSASTYVSIENNNIKCAKCCIFSKGLITYGQIKGNSIKADKFTLRNIAGDVNYNYCHEGSSLDIGIQSWEEASYSQIMGNISSNILFPSCKCEIYGTNKSGKKFERNVVQSNGTSKLFINANVENSVVDTSNFNTEQKVNENVSYSYIVGEGDNPLKVIPKYNLGS